MRRPGVSIEERFWEKVQKHPEDGCWEWTGALSVAGGYGMFYVSPMRPTMKAHRFAWELEHGPLLKDELVCHKCDNPKCVRESHMFKGDYLANNTDMVKKGRHGRMKFTHDQIRRIRSLYERNKDVLSHRRIANWFGVSCATISHIMTGRNWKNT